MISRVLITKLIREINSNGSSRGRVMVYHIFFVRQLMFEIFDQVLACLTI